MVVTRVGGKLESVAGGEQLSARADDPTWGGWSVNGLFDPGFQKGDLTLAGSGIQADAKKVAAVPFVPEEVWQNIVPTGRADLRIDLKLALGTPKPIEVRTQIDLKQTTVDVKGLDLVATDSTGKVVIDDGLVNFFDVKGRSLGGQIAAPTGSMDFTRPQPAFDLHLVLDGVEAARAPRQMAAQGGRRRQRPALRPSRPQGGPGRRRLRPDPALPARRPSPAPPSRAFPSSPSASTSRPRGKTSSTTPPPTPPHPVLVPDPHGAPGRCRP